jgi:hypothetical protein
MMRFGCSLELVSDRRTHFLNEVIWNLTARYDIKHRKTTPYNPKANGLTKRVNGIVGNILTKVVSAHKTDWDEKLHSAVYAYNTSHKTTTGRSPYFLVYGHEVLQNIETEIETLRVIAFRNGERVESLDNRLEEIEALEEARGEALQRTRKVQEKRKAAFDKKIPAENGITEGKMVFLYESRYRNFPVRAAWKPTPRPIKLGEEENLPHYLGRSWAEEAAGEVAGRSLLPAGEVIAGRSLLPAGKVAAACWRGRCKRWAASAAACR